MGTSTISDAELLRRVDAGEVAALGEIIDAHLHPAWRLAVVAAPDAGRAERAVVEGFVDGLTAAIRQPDPRLGLRGRLVAATRHAATAPTGSGAVWPAADDPVVAAFRTLPEAWRTALWLVEVEGGSPEQVAPVLGLNRSAAAALADRAAAGLRDRLAADVADRAEDPECRKALTKLPAVAAGKLTAAERDAVGAHLAGCGSCAVWLAALLSPRPALRRMITAPSATLPVDIEARWLAVLDKRGGSWLGPLTERAVGAAAAAVLAIGIGGAALLGGRDNDDEGPELALPAAEPTREEVPAGGTGSTGGTAPTGTGGSTTGSTTASSTSGTGGTGGTSGSSSTTPTTATGSTGGSGGFLVGSGGGGGSTLDTPRSGSGSNTTPTTTPPTQPPPTTPPDDGEQPPAGGTTSLGVPGVLEVEVSPDEGTVGVDVLGGTATVGLGGPGGLDVEIPGLL